MSHPFLARFAEGLALHDVAVLRYQFPYMEQGSRRVDSPTVAQATVRAAVACARRALPRATLAAGGKSFGGRMTSLAQATAPLDGVAGLVFIGFPLHAAGKPSIERASHLDDVHLPMLFLQGTRDALAELSLLAPLVAQRGARATLHEIPEGDHSFHVPARCGRNDDDVLRELSDVASEWIKRLPPN